MGIDVNEWASRLMSAHSKLFHHEPFTPTIELFVDICRAIIADEAAKASGAKSPTPGSVRRVDDAVQAVADALGCTFAVDTHNATKTAEGIRELVEAVVALRCNSEPAASEQELDEPPRAEGVPEWCIDAAREVANVADETLRGSGGSNRDLGRIVRRHAEAEIARRVAEAKTKLANETKRADNNAAMCSDASARIVELTAERDQARAEAEKFKTTDVGTLVADAIRADRESDERECRREIRRLRAEVERLKARQLPDGWEMSGTLGDNRRRIAELEAEIERLQGEECIANKKQKQRIAELESRVADQCGEIERLTKSLRVAEKKASFIDGLPFCPDHRDKVKGKPCRECEIERLSRPVDLGAVHKTRVDGIDYVYDYDARQAVRNERNAREAAEAALAELRELIRTHYLMWSAADASTEWSFLKRMKSCPEDELNAALAKFRKHKEQAT